MNNLDQLLKYIDAEIAEADQQSVLEERKFRVAVNSKWNIRAKALEDVRNQILKKGKDNSELGLYNKYIISKSDGSTMDPRSDYFVLRLDKWDACDDETLAHRYACRAAIVEYARHIKKALPKLSEELIAKYKK